MADVSLDSVYVMEDENTYLMEDENTYTIFGTELPSGWEANDQGAIIGGSNVKDAIGGSGGQN